MAVAAALARRWLLLSAERVGRDAARLTALDAAIGDGDHGINLDRGFTAIRERLDASDGDGPLPLTAAALFSLAGRTLVSTVGGAAGPLYGTFFIALGTELGDEDQLAAESFGAALEASVAAVGRRGRSTTGEKTMLDALVPGVNAWRAAMGMSLLERARAAARAAGDGCAATVPIVATKGRASYLGERSRGHMDPGAASSALLLEALADAIAQLDDDAEASR
jgi:dihydroxyacetone kinase-like protein